MTKKEVRELTYEEIEASTDQELLRDVEKKGTNFQRISVCINKNTNDDILRTILKRRNAQLLDFIIINKKLTAVELFPYLNVSRLLATRIQKYDDFTPEMLEYIKEGGYLD